LPNLIAQKKLVPEFIQDEATPQQLSEAVLSQLTAAQDDLLCSYAECRAQLQCNASKQAAQLILNEIALPS
jgi:lipid-A-disaccharide synthase